MHLCASLDVSTVFHSQLSNHRLHQQIQFIPPKGGIPRMITYEKTGYLKQYILSSVLHNDMMM